MSHRSLPGVSDHGEYAPFSPCALNFFLEALGRTGLLESHLVEGDHSYATDPTGDGPHDDTRRDDGGRGRTGSCARPRWTGAGRRRRWTARRRRSAADDVDDHGV